MARIYGKDGYIWFARCFVLLWLWNWFHTCVCECVWIWIHVICVINILLWYDIYNYGWKTHENAWIKEVLDTTFMKMITWMVIHAMMIVNNLKELMMDLMNIMMKMISRLINIRMIVIMMKMKMLVLVLLAANIYH